MEDMFNTLIKLVEAQWSLKEDYVLYKFTRGTHKDDFGYGNNYDLIQGRFALIKVKLFLKERKLLDGI